MVKIGQMNHLRIIKEVDFGFYLNGGDIEDGGYGEILLPMRYAPSGSTIGDTIHVFVYFDSEDRIIATTETPYAMVGSFALLEVSAINAYGAFLNWGLSKDLLLPFNEQIEPIKEGEYYVVCLFVDEESQRITASAKLNSFLHDEAYGAFHVGEAVELFVAAKTNLGYKMVINNSHWGLLHHHDIVQEPKIGEHCRGYIKQIRDDDRIDLCLHRLPSEKSDAVADSILDALESAGGFLAISDKSSPDVIKAKFGISKKLYKKAIGSLYRKRKISIKTDGIHLHKKD